MDQRFTEAEALILTAAMATSPRKPIAVVQSKADDRVKNVMKNIYCKSKRIAPEAEGLALLRRDLVRLVEAFPGASEGTPGDPTRVPSRNVFIISANNWWDPFEDTTFKYDESKLFAFLLRLANEGRPGLELEVINETLASLDNPMPPVDA